MGSGLITLQKPPGRRKADDGGRTAEDGGVGRSRGLCSIHRVIEAKLVFVCFQIRLDASDRSGRDAPPSSVLRHPLSDSERNQAERAISTGKLNALPRLHIRPIDVVVFHGPSGRSGLEAGFPLRCLQRLSIPYIATLHRRWRDDRSTRDTFTPVLSY